MKLAFAMLAHGSPALVERLIKLLTSEGHLVAVHYDAKASDADFNSLTKMFSGNPAVRFARREKVGWGQWGVTQGALNCLDEIEKAGWNPTYVYHISGMDYPIRSSAQLVEFLKRNNGDEFIESVPANTVKWVKTGPQRERYDYHWWFNWRSQPNLTESFFYVQKRLGIKRRFVRDMEPHIGSQWWVLTWKTLKKIRAVAKESDIIPFFKSTLVPDEIFFQTLIRYAAPNSHITNCPLTLYQFTDYGYPVVYYSDHIEYLTNQQMFFARKFSSHDNKIRNTLDLYWRGAISSTPINEARVGIVGPEYESRRRTYRYGVPGAPLIGSLNFGATTTGKPTFVIVGTSDFELSLVRDALDGVPDLVVHGQLFHPDRIEFCGERRDFAGYSSDDIFIRNRGSQRFLDDIIRASRAKTSVFLVRLRPHDELPDVLFRIADLQLVFLEGDPVIAFLESQLHTALGAEAIPQPPGELSSSDDRSDRNLLGLLDAFEEGFEALTEQVRTVVSDRLDRPIISLSLSGDGQDWCSALATHLGVDELQAAGLLDRLKSDIRAKFPHIVSALPDELSHALNGRGAKTTPEFPAGLEMPML